jgi:hypothetical protein
MTALPAGDQKGWLRIDGVAGVTTAAIVVPQSMAGASKPIVSNCAPQSRTARSVGAALGALSLAAIYTMPVSALELPAPEPAAAATPASAAGPARSNEAPAGVASDEAETPDSTEQGQTQLRDSFERRPIAALLHESRLVGLRDATINLQIRSFDLDRVNFNDSASQAWTLGGSAGFKTGYFGDVVALGATGYTSQRLDGPKDKDGTKLLQPGQQPYTVMGELYGQFRLTDKILAIAGRKELDTPFINGQDSLMTPNTFLLSAIQGVLGGDSRSLRFAAAFVDKIKPRNAQDFESMATAAGAPAGVERGVYAAGAHYKAGEFSIGAVEYYSADIINISYAETRYAIPLANRVSVRLGAQYTDQHSTGDDLLKGKPFSTHQYGFKAELALGPTLLTAARTVTAIGTVGHNGGTDMINPWGGYPGYTAVQIENFYRAGEDATMLRAAYNFPRVTGLSMYGLWVHGSTPDVVHQYAQDEYDVTVKWIAPSASLKGLTLLARYGHVSQGGPSDQHEDELRLVLYYQLR